MPKYFVSIIAYREITGNKNKKSGLDRLVKIIAYREITGNKNPLYSQDSILPIIAYREITGNKNLNIYNMFIHTPFYDKIHCYAAIV